MKCPIAINKILLLFFPDFEIYKIAIIHGIFHENLSTISLIPEISKFKTDFK